MWTKKRGLLIELDDDDVLDWFGKEGNSFAFCVEVGPDVVIKPRAFATLVFNVPLTFDLENAGHRDELCEANNMGAEACVAARWIKPITRRNHEQKTAHLILSFTDPSLANRAIARGLLICNRRLRVEKVKREPTRCLKCQGWFHHAFECMSASDKCGNCTEEHRTSQCPHPQKLACVSCDSAGHPSWSRNCPVFLRKVSECDVRNPENTLAFYPTKEGWTSTSKEPEREVRTKARAKTNTNQQSEPTLAAVNWKSLGSFPKWVTDLPLARSWADDEPANITERLIPPSAASRQGTEDT